MKISLVIPVKNEQSSIGRLLDSILAQTFQADEIIVVDGGSLDETALIVRGYSERDDRVRLIEAGLATPGKGRNIGIAAARSEWIALTDAGITLALDWLEQLTAAANSDPEIEIVYGNFEPVCDTLFASCVALCTLAPREFTPSGRISQRFIASSLLRKSLWQRVGGFPDQRAAEDLEFMEALDRSGAKAIRAPKAMVQWEMQPSISSTFQRFRTYSFYNVLAHRQRDWHYGVARIYLLGLAFVTAGALFSKWWLLAPAMGLAARSCKSIWAHREERPVLWALAPLRIFGVSLALFVIDAATFAGWISAVVSRRRSPERKLGLAR